MKKQIIIALAVSLCAFSFAQKKELKEAEKSIRTGGYFDAKKVLQTLEPSVASMDNDLKDKYYYLSAKAMLGTGRIPVNKVDDYLALVDKISDDMSSEKKELVKELHIALSTNGNTAYKKKQYSKASEYFEKTYRLKETDTTFLYYAASTAISDSDYDRALGLYLELKDLGYTGIRDEYFAMNAETAENEVFDKETRDLYVKLGTHVEPGVRKVKSKKPEIYKNIALIYVNKGDNEKALAAMEDARKENPDDVGLILSSASVSYKAGDAEGAKKLYQKAIEIDPNNPELRYNLGVTAAESGANEEAIKHYKKAVELDPDYVDAYINIASITLAGQKAIVKEMNSLGTSKADDLRYEELKKKREGIYVEAKAYLEKAVEIDDQKLSAAQTLRDLYRLLGETEKFNEMKAKVEAILASKK